MAQQAGQEDGMGHPWLLKPTKMEVIEFLMWLGRARNTLRVTVHREAEREIGFKTPCMGAHDCILSHDCIHENSSELGQAVNGAKSSSPAMSKLLHNSETPESNTVPAVQESKVQNRIGADSLATPDEAQYYNPLYQLGITLQHLRFGLSVVEAQFVFLFCLRLTSRALSKPVSELSSHRFLQRHLNWNETKPQTSHPN